MKPVNEYAPAASEFELSLGATLLSAIECLNAGENVATDNPYAGVALPVLPRDRRDIAKTLTSALQVVQAYGDPEARPEFDIKLMRSLFGGNNPIPKALTDFSFDQLLNTIEGHHPILGKFDTDQAETLAYKLNSLALAMVSGTHAKYAYVELIGGLLSALHSTRLQLVESEARCTVIGPDQAGVAGVLDAMLLTAKRRGVELAQRATFKLEHAGRHATANDAHAAIARLAESLAGPDEPLLCDFCQAPTDDPWHGSGMLNGQLTRHIHACDDCHSKLPTSETRI